MPKLMVFAPCRRAIVSEGDGASSLIDILQAFSVQPPPSPADLVHLPLEWALFSLWRTDPSDIGVEYEVRCDFVAKDGSALLKSVVKFTPVPAKAYQRVINNVFGFPIKGPGEYEFRLYLSDLTRGGEAKLAATYAIQVTFGEVVENLPSLPVASGHD